MSPARRLPPAAVLLLLAVLGAAAGLAYGLATPTTWSSSAHVVVSGAGEQAVSRELGYAAAFAKVGGTDAVLGPAAAAVGADPTGLADRVSVTSSRDAPVIQVTASAAEPARAAELATVVARALVAYGAAEERTTAVTLTEFAPASLPVVPSSVSPALAALSGAAGGVVLAVLLLIGPGPRTAPGTPPTTPDDRARTATPRAGSSR